MFVVFEGIDGSGKGTQAERLRKRFSEWGIDVALMAFPQYEQTTFGRVVGEFLDGRFGGLKEVHPKLAAIPYALDRWESLSLLRSHLAVRQALICDRYAPSNIAHQCAKLGRTDGAQQLAVWLDRLEYDVLGLPIPDMVQLDLPVEWVNSRLASKAKRGYTAKTADIHEADLEYLEQVRQHYVVARELLEARHVRWEVIDARGTDFQVGDRVWRTITAHEAGRKLIEGEQE